MSRLQRYLITFFINGLQTYLFLTIERGNKRDDTYSDSFFKPINKYYYQTPTYKSFDIYFPPLIIFRLLCCTLNPVLHLLSAFR